MKRLTSTELDHRLRRLKSAKITAATVAHVAAMTSVDLSRLRNGHTEITKEQERRLRKALRRCEAMASRMELLADQGAV